MADIKKVKGVKQEKRGGKPTYGEMDLPELQDGDVLIDVHAAPINPSDQYLIQGVYPEPRQFPGFPGIEGSGKIIKAQGQDIQDLVGKHVSFTPKHNQPTGTYAEYAISTKNQVFVLEENTDLDQAACAYINPFTVVYMLQKAKKLNAKAVVHDVGASSLGKKMIRYFQDNGLELINIVRRNEQVEEVKKLGSKHVLNSSEDNFWEQFKKITKELEATVAFDAIGGEFATNLIKNMPDHSHIFQYGILSGDYKVEYNAAELLFQDKHISSFWLVTEIQNATPEQAQKVAKECTSLITNKLSTDIVKKFKFEDIDKALDYYSKNMSAGKVLITKHA